MSKLDSGSINKVLEWGKKWKFLKSTLWDLPTDLKIAAIY